MPLILSLAVITISITTTNPSSANTRVLDLSHKGLTRIDASIYDKTDTTELVLSHNQLRSLPSEMGRMNRLIVVKVDNNTLEGNLIGEIRQMSQLRILDVSHNQMTGMPAEIGQLHSLETLNYSHNRVTGLPNELSKLSKTLKQLDLTGNSLSPDQIDKLRTELPHTTIMF